MITAFVVLAFVGSAIGSVPTPRAPDREANAKAIEELVAQLGSPQFQAREEASRRLMAMPAAIPALRKAAASRDTELARRASQILEFLVHTRGLLRLDRGAEAARSGRVDVFAEYAFVPKRVSVEDRCWQDAIDLAYAITRKAEEVAGMKFCEAPRPKTDFRAHRKAFPDFRYIDQKGLRLEEARGKYALRTDCLKDSPLLAQGESPLLTQSVVLASDSIQPTHSELAFANSFVFCNGPVRMFKPQDVLIICDGDLVVRSGVYNSILIVNGNVSCKTDISKSMIIATGKVDKGRRPLLKNNYIREGEREPLGFVRFFQTSDAGLEVAAADGGVRVSRLIAGQPPAKAGLKEGDLITAVEGEKVASADGFRRQLRRAVALGETTLTVNREGNRVELSIFFEE